MKLENSENLAESDDVESIKRLALEYAVGRELPEDLKKSFYWYSKAAEFDDPDALYNLGFMYVWGEGVSSDEKRGVECFFKASRLGSSDACLFLAESYMNGFWDLEINYNLALDFSLKAAYLGNLKGMHSAGRLVNDGKVSPKRLISALLNFGDDF